MAVTVSTLIHMLKTIILCKLVHRFHHYDAFWLVEGYPRCLLDYVPNPLFMVEVPLIATLFPSTKCARKWNMQCSCRQYSLRIYIHSQVNHQHTFVCTLCLLLAYWFVTILLTNWQIPLWSCVTKITVASKLVFWGEKIYMHKLPQMYSNLLTFRFR